MSAPATLPLAFPFKPEGDGGASGLRFEDAFYRAIAVDSEGVTVHIPSVADLIRNKRASGRTKDLADAETLEREDQKAEP